MTAIHFVDFEISREKGNFLKTTIGYLGTEVFYENESVSMCLIQ